MQETHHQAIDSLKEIYNLENVDPKSVKALQVSENEWKEKRHLSNEGHVLFDFGAPFCQSMDSLILEEPIEVLNLSSQALKALKKQKKTLLADLRKPIEGLGLGHQEEIEAKLQQYLQNQELYYSKKLSLKSLVLRIAPTVESKALFEHLKTYQIENLVELSKEQMQAIASEQEIANEENCSFLQKSFQKITEHLLIPWMQGRSGIASCQEIMEWLCLRDQHPQTENIARFLQDCFFQGHFLFQKSLIQMEDQVFAADEESEKKYRITLRVIESYYYKRGLSYPLKDLCLWIQREAAKEWFSIESAFLQRCLAISEKFIIRNVKGPKVFRT